MERKRTTFFILIAVLIGVIIGIFIWKILAPKLGAGVFYYRLDGNKANLILLNGKGEGEKVLTVDAQEVDLGKYKPPRYTFVSSDNRQMVYFKKTKEEIIQELGNDMVASRIFYEPILVNLKTGTEKKINQPVDASTIVFSSDNNNIAWIKEIKESTFDEIQKNQTKREIWTSRADGENAQLLTALDDNVVLLRRWNEDYIYFQGVSGVNAKSIGRINIINKKVDYITPKGCEEGLINCQNISFSSTGNFFLYEIYSIKNNKEITELYLGDFERKEFKPILTTDRISDKVWLESEKGFVYTEQEEIKGQVKETAHLVDLYRETDIELYSGSYLNELAFDGSNDYLYFLEKVDTEEINMFDLKRLNIKSKKAEKVLTENYNNILIIQ
jgi:hypothetical protein